MNECWNNVIITEISIAVYVTPDTGKHIHKNRPFHGFVLNDADSIKNYRFDNGRVMHTKGNSLFYLPKGSSYYVESLQLGGCYAVNFDTDIADEPFAVDLRNPDDALHHFKAATDSWKNQDPFCRTTAMRAVYDAIYHAQLEIHRQYVSKTQFSTIAPAVEILDHNFTENDLSVASLAALCGISEVYFRRLFLNSFGVSPKEYIIRKRIEFAKSLLKSGSFPVYEIASLCGYSEPCHFSREFSKRVGVSPSRYVDAMIS